MTTKIRSKYDHHETAGISFDPKEGITKSEFAEEANINNIIDKYQRTGMLPAARSMPQFGDFSNVPDYQTALESVRSAEEAFYALPADVRAECDNDPGVFVDRVRDEPEFRRMLVDKGLGANPPESPKEPLQEAPKAPAPAEAPKSG